MSTWDDKPNDYDHAVRIIGELEAKVVTLRSAVMAAIEAMEQNGAMSATVTVLRGVLLQT